ncbi:MAG: hypothetical protein EBV15_01680 [Bacteroidetes bacterium]|nr:hypothetical protein [Bacteroidota bacterium]
MSLTKTQIHEYCLQELTNRLQNAREAMAALHESVAADTKSSMGDKYETAREMAQQELEKISRQMGMLQQSLGIFNRIQSSLKLTVIGLGALIETDKGFFYMAAPLGKIVIQNQEIMVISPQSPAGKVMLGKKVGNSFELNGTVFQILSVA